MRLTQKMRIYNYLKKRPSWHKSYEMQGMAMEFSASPATVDRRLRDLAAEGSVERRRVGKFEEYRIKQSEWPKISYMKVTVNEKLFNLPEEKKYRLE